MNNTETISLTDGAHHIGLTVPDIKQIRDFFIDTLNFKQVGEIPDYPAVFVSDGTVMITLWQVLESDNTQAFDRKKNIGLHHLALKVSNAISLEKLYQRLLDSGKVNIEFAPEKLGNGPIEHMMCTIPGGIRLELIAPAI